MLDGVLCVIFLHGRSSPQTSPSATPCLMKSLSFEAQPEELEEQPLSPMHYARSGLGTAALNGKFVAAGQSRPLRESKAESASSGVSLSNCGDLSSLLRRLQQRGMSEDGGVLRPQRGPLDIHRAHADSQGSVPDGCSHGREKFGLIYLFSVFAESTWTELIVMRQPRTGSAVRDRGLQRTFRRAELRRAVRPAGRRVDPGAGTEDEPLQRRSVELKGSAGRERTSRFSLWQWLNVCRPPPPPPTPPTPLQASAP